MPSNVYGCAIIFVFLFVSGVGVGVGRGGVNEQTSFENQHNDRISL